MDEGIYIYIYIDVGDADYKKAKRTITFHFIKKEHQVLIHGTTDVSLYQERASSSDTRYYRRFTLSRKSIKF
jgi:hypothetical protein